MTTRIQNQSGFSLVAVLLMILLVLSLSVYLGVLMANESALTSSLDSQLYSLLMAENGLEYARALLPHLELNQVLVGPDGRHSGTSAPEWRSPLAFDVARHLDAATWSPACDDGWPAYRGSLLLEKGYAAAGDARFYIRFSNNPDEPADKDTDGVVLVRSLGLTRTNRYGLFHASKNNVSLVEAVLRQEKVFDLRAALVLFGENGAFQWPTETFELDGGGLNPAVMTVGGPQMRSDFLSSLGGQGLCIHGIGGAPSAQDGTAEYMASVVYRRVFDPRFWEHFQDQLPAFADAGQPGLCFYPAGGTLTGPFQGILVACGDLTIAGASVEGLILHLGRGALTLRQGTTVRGGIWMSNTDTHAKGKLAHQPLDLKVVGSVSVLYDPDAVRRSLTLIPPTQLGWRILFPEMKL